MPSISYHKFRNILQRIRWQACRRFASCPSCHGLGAYTTVKRDKKKRKLVPANDRFKVTGLRPMARVSLLSRVKWGVDMCSSGGLLIWHSKKTNINHSSSISQPLLVRLPTNLCSIINQCLVEFTAGVILLLVEKMKGFTSGRHVCVLSLACNGYS